MSTATFYGHDQVIFELMSEFADAINADYGTDGAALDLGRGVLDGQVQTDSAVKIPLRMLNRHGLIAGATGTGKTKTLQGLAEQLSDNGVPVFVADMKGDLSGLALAGETGGPAQERANELAVEWTAQGFPLEVLSIGGIGPGVPMRATVSDMGPQLLGKIIGANQTQEQSLGLVFNYADSKGLPLLDLSDLRALLTFLDSADGKAELKGIGGLSSATVGVLLRALGEVEAGGGNEFFGEPQFDINDLMRTTPDGKGLISCLELPAVQDKPKLFSTAMMWMLAELFETLPEVGDLEKPKLVFFFDEAHLLFADATDAFLEQVITTIRLIRSKGVGIFFVTQLPTDIPKDVLAQLGNRVQHALRIFTPDDEKALKATARTFPKSSFYKVDELLTSMGTGEAAITVLSEKGTPTQVVHTKICPPRSRMGAAEGLEQAAKGSSLWAKYGERVDSESAREMLAVRLEAAQQEEAVLAEAKAEARHKKAAQAIKDQTALGEFMNSSIGKQIKREVVRGAFKMLKKRLF